MKKKKKFAWYSSEADAIFEVDLDTSARLLLLCVTHAFNMNQTMLYLGEI